MADLEKTIQVIFRGTDELGGTIGSIGKGIDQFSGKVGAATQPLADLSDMVVKAETVLIALAVGGLAYATNEAGKFGDQFNEIATLIEVPAEQLDTFREDIIQYARDSTQSFEDINSAIYNAISAGIRYEDVVSTLRVAEELAIATKAGLNDTIQLLVPTLNAYGVGMESAADYADILFTTVKTGKTTLPELGTALSGVIGIAASAGVGFDELSAAIAALTGYGAPTSQAITQIKSAIVALVKPSSEAEELAAKLGIQFNAEALAAKGLEGVFQEVYTATGGNVTAMGQLFGRVEGLNAALILGGDAGGKFADALKGMEERAGAASVAFKKMEDNFKLVNQNLINNIKATLIDVGEPLLDDWAEIAAGFASVFEGVSIGIGEGAFDDLFKALDEATTEIAKYFTDVAKAIPEALSLVDWEGFIGSFQDVFESLGALFDAFFGNLDLTKPEDLAVAMQKGVDAVTALNNVFAGIIDSFEPFIRKIGEMTDEILDSDDATQNLVGQVLGWGKQINLVAGILPELTGALNLLSISMLTMSATRIPAAIAALGNFGPAILSVATGPVGLFIAAVGAGSVAAYELGGILRENVPYIDNQAKSFQQLVLGLNDLDKKTIDAIVAQSQHTEAMGMAAVAAVRVKEALDAIPIEKKVDIELEKFFQFQEAVEWSLKNLEAIPGSVTTKIEAEADIAQVQQEWNKIYAIGPDGNLIEVAVAVNPDNKTIEDTKKKIDEIPEQKLLEIEVQGNIDVEIAKINAQAQTLQAAFEWEAKVDIAEIEAAFAALEATSQNIANMFESTGDVIIGIASLLGDADSSTYLDLMQLLREENARRDEMLLIQKDIADAEIRYLDAKTRALEAGEGLITIDTSGVYPELDLVMIEIIKRAQVRANEDGHNLLLGV